MTQDFASLGPTLIAMGYQITPIRPGAKAPILRDWTNQRLTADDCSKYAGAGVGIICGNVVAIDIDSTDESISQAMVEMLEQEKGAVPIRVGRAPKTLAVVRLATQDIRKMSTAVYNTPGTDDKHQLELLAKGQQFVAYGIHPATGKPYEWTDLMGGLTEFKVDEIPVVTVDDLQRYMARFDELCRAAGMQVQTAAREAGSATPSGSALSAAVYQEKLADYTVEKAQADLAFISSDAYDTWITIGQALEHQFGEAGFELWDAWSAGSTKYDPDQCVEKWKTFGQHTNGDIRPATARTIIKLAGEERKRRDRQARQAEIEAALASLETATDGGTLMEIVGSTLVADPANRLIFIAKAQQRFKELTGVALPKEQVERALPHAAERQEHPFTEYGNALRMEDIYGAGVMRMSDTTQWYSWAATHWECVSDEQIEQYAAQTIEELRKKLMPKGVPTSQEASKFVAASERYVMYKHMVDILKSRPGILHTSAELDQHPELFVCGNGVLNLRTGSFSTSGNPKDLLTQHTPVCYDATAKCPLWRETLDAVFLGRRELIDFFQTAIGYTMLGDPVEHLLFILYGNGANGKSTILNTIRSALGGYSCMGASDTFLGASKGTAGGARADLLELMGKRMVYVEEPNQDMSLKEGTIKSMTGGESVKARGLYAKASTEYQPVCAIWMPTNHLPLVKGMDEGIWRRLAPIPFDKKFDMESRDSHRTSRLKEELPGILNWMLEGALRYQREGLKLAPEVQAARNKYRTEMDLTAEWIETCCVVDPNEKAASKALFNSWRAYASSVGTEKYLSSQNALGRALASKGFRSGQIDRRTRGFFGIGLREPGVENGEDFPK